MSNIILILGESGTGKSASVEYLKPEETFIFNVNNKPLPFRGWKTNYIKFSKDNLDGNILSTTNYGAILRALIHINDKRPEIRQIIIDDFNYLMIEEYMTKALDTGFKKFTEIAVNLWNIVSKCNSFRDDLFIFFTGHIEYYDFKGEKRCRFKTIGKLIDEKVVFEGYFSTVLYTDISRVDDKNTYSFTTQNDGSNTCKSPKGMFDKFKIPNDLSYVINAINKYDMG